MALSTTFNRLKREIGIKRCIILDGNVGDVYLNEKKQIVDQIAATKILQEFMDTKKRMTFDIEKYKKIINDTE